LAIVDVTEIIEAGVHFGHRASRWHPKMKPFIFGKRNLIHIVDVRQTIRGLVRANNFLVQMAATGKDAVVVGTKRQAKSLVTQEAQRARMHWVSERWLGGSLTNFHTIRQRLKRLEELEAMEANGSIEDYSKKRISTFRRERRKILRNLEGLRNMKTLPGCLVVIDIRREHIAVAEARKMGIPVVGLVDTDCDPRDVDIVIPGNDDAFRSIQVVLRVLADAVILGRKAHEVARVEAERARSASDSERTRGGGAKAAATTGAAAAPSASKPKEPTKSAESATTNGGGATGEESTPAAPASPSAPVSSETATTAGSSEATDGSK
jgi:small subunit ribosomal protein S2